MARKFPHLSQSVVILVAETVGEIIGLKLLQIGSK